jgi:hypothetical protein
LLKAISGAKHLSTIGLYLRRTLVRLDGVRSFTEAKIKAKAVGGDGNSNENFLLVVVILSTCTKCVTIRPLFFDMVLSMLNIQCFSTKHKSRYESCHFGLYIIC